MAGPNVGLNIRFTVVRVFYDLAGPNVGQNIRFTVVGALLGFNHELRSNPKSFVANPPSILGWAQRQVATKVQMVRSGT